MDVLERLRAAADQAFDREPVDFAYLFGSQARGSAEPDSDIDIAAHLEGDISDPLRLSLRLARRLERVARVGSIEAVVILNTAPLPLAGRVVLEGRVFYSRDEPKRVDYESLIFRKFTDFDLMARALDEELLRGHANGTR